MIMCDFNAHNPLWGSDKVTDKDKIVKDVLSNLNLCILNDGSNTFTPGQWLLFLHWLNNSRPFLSFRFTLVCTWRFCGSDHFPIIVEGNDPLKTDFTENCNLTRPTGPYSKISACKIFWLKNLKTKRILLKNLRIL